MSWSNLFYMMSGRPQLQAALIGLAWITAKESGDIALVSNLLCNMMHPTGVCQALDLAGVPGDLPSHPCIGHALFLSRLCGRDAFKNQALPLIAPKSIMSLRIWCNSTESARTSSASSSHLSRSACTSACE